MPWRSRSSLRVASEIAPRRGGRVPEDAHAGERRPGRLQVAPQVPAERPGRHSPQPELDGHNDASGGMAAMSRPKADSAAVSATYAGFGNSRLPCLFPLPR